MVARSRIAIVSGASATDGGEALAIGIDGKGVRIRGRRHVGDVLDAAAPSPLSCPTAAVFLDQDRLVVANGSACSAPRNGATICCMAAAAGRPPDRSGHRQLADPGRMMEAVAWQFHCTLTGPKCID
jgi:hypothetical protein